jgi:hypothetical protein
MRPSLGLCTRPLQLLLLPAAAAAAGLVVWLRQL